MKSVFLDYFYHDVQIKEISYNLNNEDGKNSISFILNDIENDGFGDVKCLFKNIHHSVIDMPHFMIGDISISLIEVNCNEKLLLEYKERMNKYIPIDVLEKLKCYCIYTTNGGKIKIIARCDIEFVDVLKLE